MISSNKSLGYIPQLTFTRFIAAIAIVFFHYAQTIEPFSQNVDFVGRWNTAVSYFFVLSGFIMIIVSSGKSQINAVDYYRNRFLRIYPLFFLALVLLIVYFVITATSMDLLALVCNVFLIQAWIPSLALSYNYPSWSICVEVFFYALFPLLFNKLYTKVSFRKVASIIILFFIATQLLVHGLRYSDFFDGRGTTSHYFILFFPLFHLCEFLVGNLLGLVIVNGSGKRKNNILPVFFLIVVYLLILLYSEKVLLTNGILSLVFVPMIYFLVLDNGVLSKFLSLPICIFLGEISYAIYILQSPIFIWMSSVFKRLDISNPYIIFYGSLCVLLISSALSYLMIEKWVRKFRTTSMQYKP